MQSGLAPNLYSFLLLPSKKKKKYQFCRLLFYCYRHLLVTLVGYFLLRFVLAYHSNTYLLLRFCVLACLPFVSHCLFAVKWALPSQVDGAGLAKKITYSYFFGKRASEHGVFFFVLIFFPCAGEPALLSLG